MSLKSKEARNKYRDEYPNDKNYHFSFVTHYAIHPPNKNNKNLDDPDNEDLRFPNDY